MNLLSLKARIQLGAILWTIGMFMIAFIFLHFAIPPLSVHGVFHWTFRYGPALALVAAICMLFGFLQVRRGLSPINLLVIGLHLARRLRHDSLGGGEIQFLTLHQFTQVDSLRVIAFDQRNLFEHAARPAFLVSELLVYLFMREKAVRSK